LPKLPLSGNALVRGTLGTANATMRAGQTK